MSLNNSKEKFTHSVKRDVSRDITAPPAPDVVGFGIFYGNGSSYFGKTEEEWKKARITDVQVILLYYDKYDELGNHYQHSVCGWDYYTFDGVIYEASNDTRNLSSNNILYGKWMQTEIWKNIADKAVNTLPQI